MPSYTYKCKNNHEVTIRHAMTVTISQNDCPECKSKMVRVWQMPHVNWGGLPPHLASARGPAQNYLINSEHERRAEYLDTKED